MAGQNASDPRLTPEMIAAAVKAGRITSNNLMDLPLSKEERLAAGQELVAQDKMHPLGGPAPLMGTVGAAETAIDKLLEAGGGGGGGGVLGGALKSALPHALGFGGLAAGAAAGHPWLGWAIGSALGRTMPTPGAAEDAITDLRDPRFNSMSDEEAVDAIRRMAPARPGAPSRTPTPAPKGPPPEHLLYGPEAQDETVRARTPFGPEPPDEGPANLQRQAPNEPGVRESRQASQMLSAPQTGPFGHGANEAFDAEVETQADPAVAGGKVRLRSLAKETPSVPGELDEADKRRIMFGGINMFPSHVRASEREAVSGDQVQALKDALMEILRRGDH